MSDVKTGHKVSFFGSIVPEIPPNLNFGDKVEVTIRGHIDNVSCREGYPGTILSVNVSVDEIVEMNGLKNVPPVAPGSGKRKRFARMTWIDALMGVSLVTWVAFESKLLFS